MHRYLVKSRTEFNANICMPVCLIVGPTLEQELSTVAMDGGSIFYHLTLVANLQGLKILIKCCYYISFIEFCLRNQFLHSLL